MGIKNKYKKLGVTFFSEINNIFSSIGWMTIAISGYFLMAMVSVFDKYLLHSRMFSLFALGFVPFGFEFPGIKLVLLDIISGFFFIYGLLALYRAVQENEISRVSPLVGTIIPVISSVYAFFFMKEELGLVGVLAIIVLVSGGFLVSFDLPIQNLKLFKGFRYAVLSAFCQAVSF